MVEKKDGVNELLSLKGSNVTRFSFQQPNEGFNLTLWFYFDSVSCYEVGYREI